jgi:Leu/Phe-tRNA-protein transferase
MANTEVELGKFYLALEYRAEENKMNFDSDSEDGSKVVQELTEIVNEVCPGAVKETAKYKNGNIELKDLENAILKMPKEKYSLLSNSPAGLAETFYKVINSKEYNGKVDANYFDQFISDCKANYNLNHSNSKKGLGNDFEIFAEHVDKIGLARIRKK